MLKKILTRKQKSHVLIQYDAKHPLKREALDTHTVNNTNQSEQTTQIQFVETEKEERECVAATLSPVRAKTAASRRNINRLPFRNDDSQTTHNAPSIQHNVSINNIILPEGNKMLSKEHHERPR